MRMSANGKVELADREALAHTKYLDGGGVETIGLGMTASDIPNLHDWSWDDYLSTSEAVLSFNQALEKYERAVNNALLVPIPQHCFDALVSITYNIGIGGMKGSTFMRRINSGDTPERVCEAIKRWNQDNGKVVQGLINRREKECQLYLTGKYTNNGTVGVITVDAAHKPHYPAQRERIIDLI